MSQIKYNNKCIAMGRNGTSYQMGVDIYPSSRIDKNNVPFDILILNPVNSHGELTNCWIEIPLENIDELIEHLIFFRNENLKRDSGI